MFDNIGKMVRFKNGIKMRMEGACEKDNLWRGVSVVMMDKFRSGFKFTVCKLWMCGLCYNIWRKEN